MGLSFLNKKSWHTGSFQNIEKVWIAEQKRKELDRKEIERAKKLKEERHVEELKKMQVQAGLIPASALDRMDWIYEWGNKVQDKAKEEYLLGKPVEPVKEKKPAFTPVFKETTANAMNEAFTKLHEDPMFLIRQEELRRKKEIMENPMKMKDIYKEIENITKPEKKKKKDKTEKSKKHKKDKHKQHKSEKESKQRKISRDRSHRSNSSSRSQSRRRRRDSTSSSSGSRTRSRSRDKLKHDRKYNDQKGNHIDQAKKGSDAEKKTQANPTGNSIKMKMFEEYMKKRLGPNVSFTNTPDGFMPDFNINKRKRYDKTATSHLSEEEKQKMIEDMKRTAEQLQKGKEEQVKKDFADREEKEGNKKNYVAEVRKEVYSKTGIHDDLGDRVSRNIHYLARNLEEKNTFKR